MKRDAFGYLITMDHKMENVRDKFYLIRWHLAEVMLKKGHKAFIYIVRLFLMNGNRKTSMERY